MPESTPLNKSRRRTDGFKAGSPRAGTPSPVGGRGKRRPVALATPTKQKTVTSETFWDNGSGEIDGTDGTKSPGPSRPGLPLPSRTPTPPAVTLAVSVEVQTDSPRRHTSAENTFDIERQHRADIRRLKEMWAEQKRTLQAAKTDAEIERDAFRQQQEDWHARAQQLLEHRDDLQQRLQIADDSISVMRKQIAQLREQYENAGWGRRRGTAAKAVAAFRRIQDDWNRKAEEARLKGEVLPHSSELMLIQTQLEKVLKEHAIPHAEEAEAAREALKVVPEIREQPPEQQEKETADPSAKPDLGKQSHLGQSMSQLGQSQLGRSQQLGQSQLGRSQQLGQSMSQEAAVVARLKESKSKTQLTQEIQQEADSDGSLSQDAVDDADLLLEAGQAERHAVCQGRLVNTVEAVHSLAARLEQELERLGGHHVGERLDELREELADGYANRIRGLRSRFEDRERKIKDRAFADARRMHAALSAAVGRASAADAELRRVQQELAVQEQHGVDARKLIEDLQDQLTRSRLQHVASAESPRRGVVLCSACRERILAADAEQRFTIYPNQRPQSANAPSGLWKGLPCAPPPRRPLTARPPARQPPAPFALIGAGLQRGPRFHTRCRRVPVRAEERRETAPVSHAELDWDCGRGATCTTAGS